MSSTLHIHAGGPVTILSGTTIASSTNPGDWFQVHPNIRGLTFQGTLTGSSAGAAVSGNFTVQGSNDGSSPLATALGSITFTGTAASTSPASDGFSIDAHYKYIRAYMASGTTQSTGTTPVVTATPHLIK